MPLQHLRANAPHQKSTVGRFLESPLLPVAGAGDAVAVAPPPAAAAAAARLALAAVG